MTRAALSLAALLLLGCPAPRAPRGGERRPQDAGAGSDATMKTPADPLATFDRGPAVVPGEALRAWLDAQARDGAPRLVRLPVVLPRKPMGFSRRGTVGAGADALAILADDTRLGIGLADRARTACQGAASCALWLEGYWRGERDGELVLEVTRVGEPVPAEALAGALHAEVEGERGN